MSYNKIYEGLNDRSLNRIIEMAWEDRTPFGAIKMQFGLNESQVIIIMRREMKNSSFRMWRQRVQSRKTKHKARRNFSIGSHKSSRQKHVSMNQISKRNG